MSEGDTVGSIYGHEIAEGLLGSIYGHEMAHQSGPCLEQGQEC
jgi:hypothetical protein